MSKTIDEFCKKIDEFCEFVEKTLKEKDEQINFLTTHNKYLKEKNTILEREEK
tara:strand:+ start:153 stop:311 length:159 start_codon:yes stop_codon:yes gene_type:complete